MWFESKLWSRRLLPQMTDVAKKILLANRQPLPAQDVVGRGGVEIEVGLRKGQEEILCSEIQAELAHFKAHGLPEHGVDSGRVHPLDIGDGLTNAAAEPGKVLRQRRRGRRKDTVEYPVDGPHGVVGDGVDLVAERLHILGEAGLNQVRRRL